MPIGIGLELLVSESPYTFLITLYKSKVQEMLFLKDTHANVVNYLKSVVTTIFELSLHFRS